MSGHQKRKRTPDKKLAGACGLFCPACNIYIASTEDESRLQALCERYGLSSEQVRCFGCRSEQRFPYCETCRMRECSARKGFDFCNECEDYPCQDIKSFEASRPHRIEICEAQEHIKNAGFQSWFTEMLEHYSCRNCGTLNSAYDLFCRTCNTAPSCRYVEHHAAEIRRYLDARK